MVAVSEGMLWEFLQILMKLALAGCGSETRQLYNHCCVDKEVFDAFLIGLRRLGFSHNLNEQPGAVRLS